MPGFAGTLLKIQASGRALAESEARQSGDLNAQHRNRPKKCHQGSSQQRHKDKLMRKDDPPASGAVRKPELHTSMKLVVLVTGLVLTLREKTTNRAC